MKVKINTQVPTCPKCAGALVKGFRDTKSYKGAYYFCKYCHISLLIVGMGQSEPELECEYKEDPDDR